jgi:hypothetical protein
MVKCLLPLFVSVSFFIPGVDGAIDDLLVEPALKEGILDISDVGIIHLPFFFWPLILSARSHLETVLAQTPDFFANCWVV